MRRSSRVVWAWAAWFALGSAGGLARAGAPVPEGLAERVRAVTDAVLARHVDPPTRQEMILSGLRAAYKAAGRPIPNGLAQRISALSDPEALGALLAEMWPEPAKADAKADLGEAMMDGLLAAVPGGAELEPEKQRKVNESMEGNTYVGIHVALGKSNPDDLVTFQEVFEGGPAERAGIRRGDVLERVEGKLVAGRPLMEVIDQLRGAAGTDVVVGVRTPPNGPVRTVKMTRGLLPRTSVAGVRKRSDGGWDVCLDAQGAGPVGYLKVTEIMGSTPQELRAMAGRMETEGALALIVDLRGVRHASLHPTVLLADAFLDGGTIGRVRGTDRVETFRADPDALFRGRPLAVLVDENTGGEAAWLAAALQDNRRAVVVGRPLLPSSAVTGRVPVLDAAYSLKMITGTLERGDGRAFGSPVAAPSENPAGRILARGVRRVEKDAFVPDIVVEPRSNSAEARVRPRPGTAAEANGPIASDPVVSRALGKLRGLLNAS
jgi:carboxyl-terminal processing protease